MDSGELTGSRALDEEATARLALLKLPGVGILAAEALVEAFGSASAALEASADEFRSALATEARVLRKGDEAVRKREIARRTAEDLAARCARMGGWLLARGDPRYPPGLENLHAPPSVLFCRGDPELLGRRIVTVVGTRRATAYGRRVAEKLGRALSDAGVVVASGLALGVDGEAHRAALQGPGSTVAVLGCGVDRVHPKGNRGLFREIEKRGLLVSEYEPGLEPEPYRFPQRNRILAALGSATVVVEAGPKSGALITSETAGDIGRSVFAVPGPVDREQSVGPNQLIRTGIPPVLDVADILEPLGWADLAWTPKTPGEADGNDLGAHAKTIWGILGEGPAHVDELCQRADLPPGPFLAALTTLEVEGRVRALPGRRYERAARGASLR